MNRKLRDTLIALSTSGLLLVACLLAGAPPPVESTLASSPAGVVRPIADEAATGGEAAPQALLRQAPRRNASSHRKFALPYFSFAPGARGRGS